MLLSYLDEGLLGNPLPAGDYSFRVRPSQYGESLGDWSELSEAYRYTPPSQRLEAPKAPRWAGLYPLMTWTPAADREKAFDYFVRYYYSPTDGEAANTSALKDASGTLHMTLDKNGETSNQVFVEEQMGRTGAGWYYFTVQAISGDRNNWLNSPESALSDAIYFDGETVASGGSAGEVTVSDVKVQGGRLTFSMSLPAGKGGVVLAAGWLNGIQSDADCVAGEGVSLAGKTATVFFLEEKTLIPLAKAVRVTAEVPA